MRATVSLKFHWKTVEGEKIPQSNEARANLAPTSQMLRKNRIYFKLKYFSCSTYRKANAQKLFARQLKWFNSYFKNF